MRRSYRAEALRSLGGLSISLGRDHIGQMITLLSVLLGIALLAVVGVLMTGVVVFARGGEVNRRWANRLMNLRVATQAVVVLLLGALMLVHNF
jgi:hypothetical protein